MAISIHTLIPAPPIKDTISFSFFLLIWLLSTVQAHPSRVEPCIMEIDTLPVVIHVMHTGTPIGAPDNPEDSLIHDMLQLINDAFQLNGPNYGGADIGFHFALARRSPDCMTTPGITRTDGSAVLHYASGGITTDTNAFPNSAHELTVKSLSRWPNTDYLNIWIVNEIDDHPSFPGGYAFFPENNSALNDGVVLRASVVSGTNKTVIHELGHYFYLYHTFGEAWGDCLPDTSCSGQGDRICDTENCNYQWNCLSPINPCSGNEWAITDSSQGYTVLNNYMGYTDCQWMFTEGQKMRMHLALDTFRPGLRTSHALDSTHFIPPAQACIPTAVHGLSPYYGIERVIIGDTEVYSGTSDKDGAFYVDRTCHQRINAEAGDTIPIQITSSYENWMKVRAYLDLNGDGSFTQPDEMILSQDGGYIEDTLIIPLVNEADWCTTLRLRIVTDHPDAPDPTPCMLTGTAQDGVGQIEDFSLIIHPRTITSVNSGEWHDYQTWSCQCVPSLSDAIIIQSGHTITVNPMAGTPACADIHLNPGGWLQVNEDLHITGGCD